MSPACRTARTLGWSPSAGSAIPTPILSLDLLILTSAVFPSGFTAAVSAALGVRSAGVSSAFLGLLAGPYLVIAGAIAVTRPSLLVPQSAPLGVLAVALVTAPILIGLEYVLQALAVLWSSRRFPRGMTLTPFWRGELSWLDHGLMVLIVAGEELLYRQVCFETLRGSPGLSISAALGVSAVLYGLNHLYFGLTAVAAKVLAGVVYGGLYVLGGDSLWPPVVAHGLQNFAVFAMAGRRDG